MSTQSTTNNSRTGEESATAKGNYTSVQWSNNFGAISLGKVLLLFVVDCVDIYFIQ